MNNKVLEELKEKLAEAKKVEPLTLEELQKEEPGIDEPTLLNQGQPWVLKDFDAAREGQADIDVPFVEPEDNIPIYETLSVAELKLANTWPPSTLPVKSLIPYLKRLKSNDIRGLVIDDISGANINYLLSNVPNLNVVYHNSLGNSGDLYSTNTRDFGTKIFEVTERDPIEDQKFDFVFFASPYVKEEELAKYYPLVNKNGYFAGTNYNSDANIPVIKKFKLDFKISVNTNIGESGAWFWKKEDFSDRQIVTEQAKTNAKASDSHLKPEYLDKYGVGRIFIETGTYLGQTVELVQARDYAEIHSIELNHEMAEVAKTKFEKDNRVKIHEGDSIDVLKSLVNHLEEPATFWLDAHASGPIRGGRAGGSPVLEELSIIAGSGRKDHTIFIDDKRLFGSAEWSFVKLEDAMKLLEKINPSYKMYLLDGEIKDDVLCFTTK